VYAAFILTLMRRNRTACDSLQANSIFATTVFISDWLFADCQQ